MTSVNTFESIHGAVKFKISRQAVLVFLSLISLMTCAAAREATLRGVVVLGVAKTLEGERAGIRPGDVLLSWENGRARGELQSAFDLSITEVEQGATGRVRLQGVRDAKQKIWMLGEDYWGITVRPRMPISVFRLFRKGELLEKAGKVSDAAAMWKEAADRAGAPGLSPMAPWFLLHAAQAFGGSQKWDSRDDLYREAIQRASAADPAAGLEILLGWSEALNRRGRFKAAQLHYQESLRESQKRELHVLKIAFVLNRLGNVTASLGEFDAAESYYLESLALRRKAAPESLVVAASLSNLGLVEWQRGELVKAEEYLGEALRIARRIAPFRVLVSGILNNLGGVSLRRGDAPGAERYYKQALRIQERLKDHGHEISVSLNNIGLTALDLGDVKSAQIYILRALAIRMRVEPHSPFVASCLNHLAAIAYMQGKKEISEQYLHRALAIEKQNGEGGISYWMTVQGLATIAADQGHLDDAEHYYRDAIAVTRKMGPAISGGAEPLAELASILVRKRQPEEAARLFEEALDSLESEAARLGGIETVRSEFRSEHAAYYQNYIDLLIAQGKPGPALEVLERSRSRTLLEMLEESHVNIRKSVAPHLLEQEHLLHQKLDAGVNQQLQRQLLSDGRTGQQLTTVNREIEELLRQYQQLEAEIRVSGPAYAALTQPRPLSTKEIQEQLLDDDTVLLEYSLGANRSYVWAVTQASAECHELPKRSEIENIARLFYRQLAAPPHRLKAEAALPGQARAATTEARLAGTAALLSGMVLGPVRSRLNYKRILIVSDDALQYIPFAALPAPDTDSGPSLHEAPMVAEHEVITLPSALILAELRRAARGSAPPGEVAVLADPVFDPMDARVTAQHLKVHESPAAGPSSSRAVSGGIAAERFRRSAANTELMPGGRLHLPRLLFTRREAEAILTAVPAGKAMAALDFDANRTLATSRELSAYRIVHFATHGLLNHRHPELSGLVFSMVDREGRPQNGFLQLEDIYNLNLPVELVVLSACETGLGKEIHGEGLIGLARGFMYAGASRVLASLWQVDDVATAELMGRFYEAMEKEKLAPAAALRKAQLLMREQKRWSSPHYWAAFQLQGEWK